MVSKQTKAAKAVNNTHAVDEFMAQLEHPLKAEIEAIRTLILGVDPQINESIKWNAPSFSTTDHFATLKLRPVESVQLVFHTGAKVKAVPIAMVIDDPAGLLKWAAKDRGVITFTDRQDVVSKQDALVAIVRQWIGQM